MAVKKQQQPPKEKEYYFLNFDYELYQKGTEKEFLETVRGNGECEDEIFYKIDPIYVEKIKVESKIVKA